MVKSVAILGAGPVGLAAAANVLDRGMTPIVLEAGPEAGHAIRQWQHVRMFSPWEYNIDRPSARLLAAAGWNSPAPDHYPTGGELLAQYLTPLATRTALKEHIHTSATVLGVGRVGFDKVKTKGRENAPFEIRYRNGKGPEAVRADAVIDATGTWNTPNPAGAGGIAAFGEAEAASRIAYGMPDVMGAASARYANKVVAVAGAGHSAIGTLLDLVRLKALAPATRVIWLLRGDNPEKSYGGGANDQLAARGALGSAFAAIIASGSVVVEKSFAVGRIADDANGLRVSAQGGCCARSVTVDELIVATGFRPDMSFLREIRLALDPALECPPTLAPLIDPNVHSCGSVRPHGARELSQPEPGFYFAGMKSYGRAPTFLMRTGYEQVRSIVARIAGDHEAAARVELVLPETGVCSGPGPTPSTESACCAPVPPSASACCTPTQPAAETKKGCCG